MSLPLKPHIAAVTPYQPGRPAEEVERELGIREAVKLASNENALGPSPRAVAAMHAALEGVHRYPDGACHALRTALAGRLGVAPAQLVFGCGCDEVIELVAKAFVGPGDELLYAWPSFSMYPIVARWMDARAVEVPLDAGFVHDLEAMAAAVTPRTRVVIVCNPNNPTGTSVGADAFDAFAAGLPEDVILVVDEAYAEYARRPDFPDALAWVARRPATVVLRTFSKIYGLAGVRVGYGVAGAELADGLERARHPFNVSVPAQAGALAALGDDAHVERSRRVNAEGMRFVTGALADLGIETWPSDANFVLARCGAGSFERLLELGVIVRPLSGLGLPEHVRITIGTAEENERLVKALSRLREQGP